MGERTGINVVKIFGGQMMLGHVKRQRRQRNFQNVEFSDDNEKLRRELKRVLEENCRLKHIISYGNMSMLETLIDQYMDYSRIHLKKIALEIQLTDYEQSGTDKVMELIEHLESLKEELHKLIAISENSARASARIGKHNPVTYRFKQKYGIEKNLGRICSED